MTKGMLLSVFAGAALATGVVARAADAPGQAGPETAAPGYRGGPFQGLDLTADQQKRLSELRTANQRKMFATREEMVRKSSELRQLWAAPTPDVKAIRAKQAELNQLRDQMATARTDNRLAALEVLTPAQREKAQAFGGPGSGGFGPGWQGGQGPGMRGWGRGLGGHGPGMGGPGMGRGRGMGPGGGGFGGRGPGSCGMGGGWDF